MKKTLFILIFLFLFFHSTCFAQGDSRLHYLEIGAGLIDGSEYHDALEDAYSEDYNVSGGGGWLNVEIGFAINLVKNFHLTPRLRWIVGSVEIKGYSGFPPSKKSNSILLPGISGRYSFKHLYVSADISSVSPKSDLNRLEFESAGMAWGAAMGYSFDNGLELELGYLKIPVKVIYNENNFSEEANFGGVLLTLRYKLPIIF